MFYAGQALMIPVSTLYDEYIDRPKLTEQKNPFEYIVPPPLNRGRNKFQMGSTLGLQVRDAVSNPVLVHFHSSCT